MRVRFTHESPSDYARIELVGQYLFAAWIAQEKLLPIREEVGLLIDFGCGAGKSTRAVGHCVKENGAVLGVDISPGMIAEALALERNQNSRVGFKFMQIAIRDGRETIPVDDNAADAVVTTIVLQEMQTKSQLANAIAEIGRVLRPGGTFLAICVSDKITCEDFASFTYAPFPENKSRRDNVRKCRSVVSDITWERDRHWSKRTLVSFVKKAKLRIRSIEYPTVDAGILPAPFPNDPSLPWRDELRESPFLVIHSEKE